MKRIIATLMALLMLTVSFGAVAEAVEPADARVTTTITLSDVATEFSGEPAIDQVIADVLNAVTITTYEQDGESYFAIGMKQESGAVADLLTMGFAQKGEDTYINSNILGNTIVVAQDEIVPVMERLIDIFVQLGVLTEDDARAMKAELPEIMDMALAEMNASAAAEEMLAAMDFSAMNFDALMKLFDTIGSKIVQSEMDILPRNCDPAVAMYTMTMTPEEMNGIFTAVLQFVKDNPELANAIAAAIDFDNTIAPQMGGVVEGDVDFITVIDQLMAAFADAEIYGGDVVIRYWFDEDGMPVAVEAVAPMAGEEEPTNMTMNYTRLTIANGVAHSFVMGVPGSDITVNAVLADASVKVNFAIAENGETLLDMFFDYADRSTEAKQAADLKVEINIADAVVNDGFGNVTTGETINMVFDITAETVAQGWMYNEDVAVTFSLNGKEYVTVNIESQCGEAGASITQGDVVRLAELNDADFVNWFIGVFNGLESWLFNAIFALPASFMNLMNTGF